MGNQTPRRTGLAIQPHLEMTPVKKTAKKKMVASTSNRPVENTLRRIWIYRGRGPRGYVEAMGSLDSRSHDESSMAVTCAMLKIADPCLKETLKMNKEVYFKE